MNLGIFLHKGGSLEDFRKVGQDKRFIDIYLKRYSKNFNKVYVFSYADEKRNDLPENVIIVPKGVWSTQGKMPLYLHRHDVDHSLILEASEKK